MSKKTDQALALLSQVELPHSLPEPPAGSSLLEAGLFGVLLRELSPKRATAGVESLRKAYPDYNETRVAQAQEIAELLAPKGKGLTRLEKYKPAARDVQRYLKEVFQKSHGLDFTFLTEDFNAGVKLLAQMDFVGTAVSSYILYVLDPTGTPATPGLVRVLDRLGLVTRTSSMRKAREALDAFVPEKKQLEFAFTYGVVADNWCHRKPICWECPLLEACPTGAKVYKDWQVQQERLEKQRLKESARKLAQEKKDAERRAREEAREQKRREAEAKKVEREAKKKAAAEKKAQERKAAEAKRSAEKQKAAKKKAAEKKTKKKAKKPTKKKAPKKAPKKPTKKKVTQKKAAKKAAKKASKKKPTKKKVAKKKPTKKKAAKKKATKKKVAKKKTVKKPTRKKTTRRR